MDTGGRDKNKLERNHQHRKRPQKPRRRAIEIVLSTRPRHFTNARGRGPALAPLRLTLKNDSTAYIASKEVWNVTTKDGKEKLQLHYVVKWPELPAAAILVEACKILDYVSPRTLEDYEYKLSLERDVQEELFIERLKAVRRAAAELQSFSVSTTGLKTGTGTGTETVTDVGTPTTPNTKPKKRGRPWKTDIPTKKLETEFEDIAALLPSGPVTSVPSLSTPQKSLDAVADQLVENAFVDVDDEADSGNDNDLLKSHYSLSQVPATVPSPSRKSNPGRSDKSHHNPFSSRLEVHIKPFTPVSRHVTSARGSTPAARGADRWSSTSHSRNVTADLRSSSVQESDVKENAVKYSRKRRRKEVAGPIASPDEINYVVESLEGDRLHHDKDGVRRYFKVRWEGSWPPDQNPTWEPESNLPPRMIKEYLKRKTAKAGSTPVEIPGTKKRSVAPLARKYSSVAEAFEGEVEDELHHAARENGEDMKSDIGMDMEEKLLVEERERIAEPVRPLPIRADILNFASLRPYSVFDSSDNGYGHPNPHLGPYL